MPLFLLGIRTFSTGTVFDRHCQVGVRGLLADRSVGGVINTGWMVRLVVHSMLGLDHLTS